MRAFRNLLGALLCLFAISPVYAATTLLPNGKQCFTDANGAVVSGSVNMFYPNTTTPKTTWQDSGQVTQNSQPIQLDSNGCAVIYGVGQYRQQLYDGPVVSGSTSGNLLFDQLTTDTSAFNSVFWAGLAGGTPNVITVVDTGFNGTDGTVIQFVAFSTNTGATTLNPSGFGAISVVKDTTGGPIALTGGEITAGNVINVVYYATTNTFHLLNTVIASASGATSPLCGASSLVITNDSGTPNTIVDITALQAVTQSAAGLVLNRSSVSVTINTSLGTSTSTVGGMDGEAVGTSQWLYVWLIDNGSAIGGLASTSSTAPTLPSGYTYKCRVGAMPVDGSGLLYRFRQQGALFQYKVVATTNTAVIPVLANGNVGGFSATSPTLVAVTVTGATFTPGAQCGPPTAKSIIINAVKSWKGGTGGNVLVAPSTAWGYTQSGPAGSAGMIWPIYMPSGVDASAQGELALEGSSIGWASDATGGAIACQSYRDAVNAN